MGRCCSEDGHGARPARCRLYSEFGLISACLSLPWTFWTRSALVGATTERGYSCRPAGFECHGTIPVGVEAHDLAAAQREQVSEFVCHGALRSACLVPCAAKNQHPVAAEVDEALGLDAQVRHRAQVLAHRGRQLFQAEPPPLRYPGSVRRYAQTRHCGQANPPRRNRHCADRRRAAEYLHVLLRHPARSIRYLAPGSLSAARCGRSRWRSRGRSGRPRASSSARAGGARR